MKQIDGQISFFDFVFDSTDEPKITYIVKDTDSLEKVNIKSDENKNLCPYKIPTVKDIIKRIESSSYQINKSQLISDVLECGAISISNAVDLINQEEREKQYSQIINKYRPEERELLTDIFGMIYMLLSSVVYDNGSFSDYLGELFMLCNQGNKSTGQFFTPYHISNFMAKAIIDDGVVEKANNDEIITLCDPCCGGGGMMMAALDVLKNDYNINYTRNCFISCSDIDIRCVYMTYLQLALAGVSAIVKHQNSLTRETWSEWKTPAYIMQYTRFCQFENYA